VGGEAESWTEKGALSVLKQGVCRCMDGFSSCFPEYFLYIIYFIENQVILICCKNSFFNGFTGGLN